METQPLTAADCMRQGLPLPKGTTEVKAWHRTEDGMTVLRTHQIAQGSVAGLLDTDQQ